MAAVAAAEQELTIEAGGPLRFFERSESLRWALSIHLEVSKTSKNLQDSYLDPDSLS